MALKRHALFLAQRYSYARIYAARLSAHINIAHRAAASAHANARAHACRNQRGVRLNAASCIRLL